MRRIHRPLWGREGRKGNGVFETGKGPACAGFSVLEVLVAFSALLLGLLGFARAITSSMAASSTSHESVIAREAARGVMETLTTVAFDDVFVLYNGDGTDDPGGVNSAPGRNFAVDGLRLADGDADGFAGEIVFPALDAAPGVLREDYVDKQLGLPRDLNGDGVVDGDDHADDHLMLPVLVRVEWMGPNGSTCKTELRTILANVQ
jgi:hypothetical protein